MSRQTSDDPIRHDILHLLTYHRKDYDNSVLCIRDERNRTTHHGVDIDRSPILSASGDLDLLPVEILSIVLQFSDLHSLSTLRLVNRRIKAVVEGFIPYKLIIIHAPYVLDVLTRTGVASHFTAVQVFDVLCSDSCAICGRFGAFLWVPDCIRCCIPCVRVSHELMPMTQRDAKAAFGIPQKAISKVPIVHTLPGKYTLSEGPYRRRRRRLLSRERARSIAVELHGGEEGLLSYINSNSSQAKAAYDQRMAKRNARRSCFVNGEISHTVGDVTRFLVTTCLPYFNFELRSTQTGLSCKGCQTALRTYSRKARSSTRKTLMAKRDQTFTEDMFLDHFAICPDAQHMWAEHHGTNGRVQS